MPLYMYVLSYMSIYIYICIYINIIYRHTGVEFRWSWGTAILALEKFELMRAPQQFQ